MARLLLITGASGYLGRALAPLALAAGYRVAGTYHRSPPAPDAPYRALPFDLGEAGAGDRLIAGLRPAVVIHTAAAWQTAGEAEATIVRGSAELAQAAARCGARLIHLSTDLVFDGEHAPYREADPTGPVNFYGCAKAAAEALVAAAAGNHVIVRTSLITCFDPPDPRTAAVLAGLAAAEGDPGPLLFTDEHRSPVRTEDLAAALVELAGHPYCGILHVAGPERLSRYELGCRIAAHHGLSAARIRPSTVAASGLERPRDCTLDISLARALLRTPLRPLPGG